MRTLTPEKEKEINIAVSRWFKGQGLTRREAAERLGVQEMAVSMQLTRHFTPRSARRWSQAFGLNEDFLLTGEGPVCNRSTSYMKMVSETETLHQVIQSQKRTIADLKDELAQYRSLYGALPVRAGAVAMAV